MHSFDRHNRKTWPKDIRTSIFIGRAVDELGKIYLGETWTGQEVSAKKLQLIPRYRCDASIDTQIYAIRARRQQGSIGIFSEEEEIALYTGPPSDTDSVETLQRDRHWTATYESLSKQNDELRIILDQFEYIWDKLSRLILNRELRTLSQPVDGGRLRLIPVSFWKTTNTVFRSDRFQLSLVDPFESRGEFIDPHFIFVEKEGIERVRDAERIKLRKAKLRAQKVPDADLEIFLLTFGPRGSIVLPQRQLWPLVNATFSGRVPRADFRRIMGILFLQKPGRRARK